MRDEAELLMKVLAGVGVDVEAALGVLCDVNRGVADRGAGANEQQVGNITAHLEQQTTALPLYACIRSGSPCPMTISFASCFARSSSDMRDERISM